MVNLSVQLLVCGQYGDTEPFTEQGIRNKLRTYALVPVVQQDTIPIVAVAAAQGILPRDLFDRNSAYFRGLGNPFTSETSLAISRPIAIGKPTVSNVSGFSPA